MSPKDKIILPILKKSDRYGIIANVDNSRKTWLTNLALWNNI